MILPGLGLAVGLLLSACAGKDAAPSEAPVARVEVGAVTEAAADEPISGVDEVDEVDEVGERDARGGVGPAEDAGSVGAGPETEAQSWAEGEVASPTQEITFEGEDADPGLATEVRSAPKRPTLPSFRLFGTRSGDGP